MTQYRKLRIIISGGGTGGHIFPAVSIANRFREVNPDNEILFVGAKGRMEMEKVPAAGYRIEGLDISGLERNFSPKALLHNIKVPFKTLGSKLKARRLIRKFKPDIAVGVGGYASAPLLLAATSAHIPSLIQEQNSFAGLTNRMLGSKVGCICVAYEGMDRFFPKDKIVFTGNPIRSDIRPSTAQSRAEGEKYWELDPQKKHLLVLGGSLGCRTLNETLKGWISKGLPGGESVDVLWQCGKAYSADIEQFMEGQNCPEVHFHAFLDRMDLAYAAADLVLSRSGASSVSEICAAGKACIFVPSPNVAEDHQRHNAMALVSKGAARMVEDSAARERVMGEALALLQNPQELESLSSKALSLSRTDAAERIVDEAYKLLQNR